ncbi:MAG: hypothetical protein JSW58_00540 [Candidatus Latescibacterota bacterium]|nr:MAG: hypothetical protein JSW58_00540 [Candidatus Latescibacterota bacterium]
MAGFGLEGWAILLPWGGVYYPIPTLPTSGAAVELDQGLIKSITAAIGEADNEIGGLYMTRLTAVVAATDTTFPVESTLDWEDEGMLGLDGIVYHYTGKTIDSFTGITHIAAEAEVAGARIQHRIDSTVVDLNRSRSALDLLRRAFLVDYAEGDDLAVIGRNLAVPKQPIFEDDDQYRAVIKAVAYSPKGTIYGLELALDAFVGPGNYEIYEDLIKRPNEIFIILPQEAFLETSAAGSAFLNPVSWDELGGSQDELELALEPITVGSVRLKDLGEVFDFRNAIPSAVLYEYYPGATPAVAWGYGGTATEGVAVSQISGSHTNIKIPSAGQTAIYVMDDDEGARIVPESVAELSAVVEIPSAAVLTNGEFLQMGFIISDGEGAGGGVMAGLQDDMSFGLITSATGSFLGPTVTLSNDQYYEVTLRKYGRDWAELWVDGQLISRVDPSGFVSPVTSHFMFFGSGGSPAQDMEFNIKQAGAKIHTTTDYWGARETATGDVLAANPKRFVLGGGSTYAFIAGDVGKRLELSGSGVTNPKGGNNNGVYEIDSFTSSSTVELIGESRSGARVEDTNPDRITLEGDYEGFKYPDDLGKEIVISGSAAGNDGTYVIDKLLQAGSLVDFSTFDTLLEERTDVCEVVSGGFTSEPDLDYRIDPVFVDESGLNWEQSDAGSFAGTTLTLRQPLWANDLVMEIIHSDVLSAQLLEDDDVDNPLVSDPPPVYEYYPFYLSDLFSALRAFMDRLTVAGVIPTYSLED